MRYAPAVLLLLAGSLWADTMQVAIQVPVTPRIDSSKFDSVFVMNFAATKGSSERFDLNDETVKFLRNELKNRSPLKLLEPEGAPTLDGTDESVFKDEHYWQRIGALYPGALIISGQVQLKTQRRAGFQTEEVISPSGVPMKIQRFREGKFVVLEMDLYFYDGATGKTIHQESFREELTYDNPDQPALYGYYDLMDRILPRFLGAIIPQKYQETRYLLE